jgi:hypothetical protein
MNCVHEFHPIQKKKRLSFAGILSILIGLIAAAVMVFNLIAGLALLLLGVLVALSAGKRTVFLCRKCGLEQAPGAEISASAP